MALDVEKWLKWVGKVGVEFNDHYGCRCDICNEKDIGNAWLTEDFYDSGPLLKRVSPVVCLEHARQYHLIW